MELTTEERQTILRRTAAVMPIHETIKRKCAENLNLNNEERAERSTCVLLCYPGGDPEDLAATIVDLVTDLMHLAHRNDIEPDYVAHMAAEHYTAEVEEEAGLDK